MRCIAEFPKLAGAVDTIDGSERLQARDLVHVDHSGQNTMPQCPQMRIPPAAWSFCLNTPLRVSAVAISTAAVGRRGMANHGVICAGPRRESVLGQYGNSADSRYGSLLASMIA